MKHRRYAMSSLFPMDSPRSIFRISVVTLLFLLPGRAGIAGTYYVGPAATGNGGGSSRSNLKSLAGFKAAAQPGDIALLQPGSYGELRLDGGYGSASGGHVVYRADPATCSQRPATWWSNTIERLTPANSPAFTSIAVPSYAAGGKPLGHYITLDGLTVLALPGVNACAIWFDLLASHVTFHDCSIWGADVDKTDIELRHLTGELTGTGVMMHKGGETSHWNDILFDGVYLDQFDYPFFIFGACDGNVTFTDCHMNWMNAGNYVENYGTGLVTFLRCHIHGRCNTTMGDTRQRQPNAAISIASAGNPANSRFVYSETPYGDVPPVIGPQDSVRVTHGTKSQVSKIVAVDRASNVVVVSPPFDFNVAAGDTVEFFEIQHGSLLAWRGGPLTLDSCVMHGAGNTGFFYAYDGGIPRKNLLIQNCLMYNPTWTNHWMLDLGYFGGKLNGNAIIRNNTIFGGVRDDGQTNVYPGWQRNYGYAIGLRAAAPADLNTIRVTNNIFGGFASCEGQHLRNNCVFVGEEFQTDSQGDNRNNIQVTFGGKYTPYNTGWFLGGEHFAATFQPGTHPYTFIDEFMLVQGAPAIGTGSDAPGDYAMVDLLGTARTGKPDIGCFAYGGAGANRPPILQTVGNRTVAIGQGLSFSLVATDPEGDPVTFSAGGMPAGANLTGSTFAWTPTAGQIGSYQVTFTASDGQAQDAETITVTVERPNAAPILGNLGNKTVNENQALAFSVGATDADGDPLTYTATGLPNGATFTGQTFSWTPSYNQAGSYSVTFVANDGRAQDSQTIAISVANVNRAPALAGVGDRSVFENNTLAFTLLAADPDGAGLTYSATGLPAGAKLAGQNFSWTPAAGQVGSHEVTFVVSDGTLTDAETITITVASTAADHVAPVVAQPSPAANTIQVPLNNLITLHVTDIGRGVNPQSVRITVDGKLVYQGDTALYTGPFGRCSRSGTASDYQFIYQPDRMFEFDHEMTVTVNAADQAGNVMSEHAYSFATEMRAFGSIKQASKATAAGKGQPGTASDSQGNIWVTWHAGKEGARDIYVALLPAGQQLFRAETRITTDARDQCNPDLALGSDGSVYVVWQDNRRGHWDIYASVCTDGQTFRPEILLTDSEGNETEPALVVAPGSPDRIWVAWQDDRNGPADIYVASSTNAFATVTTARVTANAADQTEPDLAAGATGTIYAVWTDGRNGHADIYGAASSTAWTNVPLVTDEGNQTSPAVAMPPDGTTLHLVWMDDRSGDADIYSASSDGLPTAPLAGTSIVDDSSGADQRAPALACAGNGKVFACWEDWRNMGVRGTDLDVYFAELSTDAARTNILVGDVGARTYQGQPAVAVSIQDQPYMVWTNNRTGTSEIYCAGTTLIDPTPLHAVLVTTAAGATVGVDPAQITEPEDISLVVPPGAAPDNIRITISRILNPVISPGDCLGSYDFGPSGITFAQPVTLTIPYRIGNATRSARAYWYNSLTGAMSQQGITRIENIRISGDLYALRFRTTHFTPFYLMADDAEAASSGGGGGGGGCSISVTGDESPAHLLVPGALVALAMMVLRRRDRKRTVADTGA